ncbi:LOW QUALITY PROTEIN: golgin subfamily A member 6-like protein 22 [Carica papaya]|uniref:LOW QUALITY PROTEIN: golgin subfamily A member 6-like protein 22 n=1 Tax=Carica papaya TaxID=3649 RepID=UPI000B8C91A4|nr:LOW QUALITY PROTEIN: golgin subfamily A member 6-like protein 22 [Carica papaya]
MEFKIENKAIEAKQLEVHNKGLLAQILELETMSKGREDKLSALMKKLENNESESLSRIENLTSEINNLRTDMDSLHSHKAELEEQLACKTDEASIRINGLMDQVNELQQELLSLHSQKAERELQLESKSQDISEYLIQIEKLKEEMVSKSQDEKRILEDQRNLMEQARNLKLEMDSLHTLKSDLEEKIKSKIEENGQLRKKKLELQDKVFELEKTLAERVLRFSVLEEKHIHLENESSAEITALQEKVADLQQKLDSLRTQNNGMIVQFDREKKEYLESLVHLENQRSELMNQISNQQIMLKEQEEAYDKLSTEYKQVEGLLQESRINLEAAERKLGEMAEDLHKNAESKDQMVADLKKEVEDLQKHLEVKQGAHNELMSQIADKERMVKEQEDAFNVLHEECKQAKSSFQECTAKLEATERKMEEMAEEVRKNMSSKDNVVADLEQTVEDLRRDLGNKGDELSTLVEECPHN